MSDNISTSESKGENSSKRTWLTILLAIVFPGGGHFYLGRYKRGAIMTAIVSIASIDPLLMLIIISGIDMEPDIPTALVEDTAAVLIALGIFLLPAVLMILQIIDAYKICKRYNNRTIDA